MGWFSSKYNIPKYTIPERIPPEVARERRLTALLEKERRFAQVPNFPQKLAELRKPQSLSRVSKNVVVDSRRLVKGQKQTGPKAALIAAALSRFKESDFADPRRRELYKALRRLQAGPQNVPPSGADRRQYNPTGKDFAATVSGTVARLTGVSHALYGAKNWSQNVVLPHHVVPCIQRQVRRQVMFARHKAGVGYHSKKRRTFSSGIPC